MMKKMSGTLIAVLVAVGLAAVPGGAASADDGGTAASGALAGARGSAEVQRTLQQLAGEQSTDEIEAMMASGLPVEVAYDLETEVFTAAVWVYEADVNRAISQLGPGCSATSVCIRNSVPHGYIGTGTRAGPWSNVNYLFAGTDRATNFRFSGGGGIELQRSVSWSPPTRPTIASFSR